jgi:hypothetical protein
MTTFIKIEDIFYFSYKLNGSSNNNNKIKYIQLQNKKIEERLDALSNYMNLMDVVPELENTDFIYNNLAFAQFKKGKIITYNNEIFDPRKGFTNVGKLLVLENKIYDRESLDGCYRMARTKEDKEIYKTVLNTHSGVDKFLAVKKNEYIPFDSRKVEILYK